LLELSNVSKKVGNTLHINDVSMKLEKGSLNVLLGPTLSGKTSLMRLMAGLDRPTSGDITMDGNSVLKTPVQQRNVAMVYQQFINYPAFSVYENIASPMRVAGVDEKHVFSLRLAQFLFMRLQSHKRLCCLAVKQQPYTKAE